MPVKIVKSTKTPNPSTPVLAPSANKGGGVPKTAKKAAKPVKTVLSFDPSKVKMPEGFEAPSTTEMLSVAASTTDDLGGKSGVGKINKKVLKHKLIKAQNSPPVPTKSEMDKELKAAGLPVPSTKKPSTSTTGATSSTTAGAESMGDSSREELDNIADIDPVTGKRQRKPRSSAEAVELRRKQIHRLLLRGVPRGTIASYLNETVETISADIKFINKALKDELQNLDYPQYIANSLSFYEECRNISLRLATDTKEDSNTVKMGALRVAMEAERQKHELLRNVGLFKTVSPTDPFSGIQTGRHGSYTDGNDVNQFVQLIAAAASGAVQLVADKDGVLRPAPSTTGYAPGAAGTVEDVVESRAEKITPP